MAQAQIDRFNSVVSKVNRPRAKKWLLFVILAILVLWVFFAASRKQEYHIDEMYSYVLSNSSHADKLSSDDHIWSAWIRPEELSSFVTVQDGERFAYGRVYLNNTTDCHPPLYYWMLHTVCSFFPGWFGKWTGLGLNLLIFAATLLVIWRSSVLLIGDRWLALLPVLLYGFSPVALETVTFIRMYMLLTMLASLLVYLHIKMMKFGMDHGSILLTWFILYLGSMTHYYFIVLGFWGVLFFGLMNWKSSPNKTTVYGIGCLAAELLFFLSYPYVFQHATGTETNNVGVEVRRNLFNWRLWIHQSIALGKRQVGVFTYWQVLSSLFALVIGFALIFLLISALLQRKRQDRTRLFREPVTNRAFYWMSAVFAATFLSISFIGGEYVFLRYLYFIEPVLYLSLGLILGELVRIGPGAAKALLCVLCLCAAVNAGYGLCLDQSPYLYRETYADDIRLSAYGADSLVVVTSRNPAVPTGNLPKLSLFRRIYLAEEAEVMEKDLIGGCLSQEGECMVYLNTDTYYTDGYDPQLFFAQLQRSWGKEELLIEEICNGCLGTFYRISVPE